MKNLEVLQAMVSEVSSYCGELDYLEVHDMESIDDILHHLGAMEVIGMADNGDFDINDDYFKLDGYGNLDSFTTSGYESELEYSKDEIIRQYIDTFGIDGELMDELDLDFHERVALLLENSDRALDEMDDILYDAITDIFGTLGFDVNNVDDVTNHKIMEIRSDILDNHEDFGVER